MSDAHPPATAFPPAADLENVEAQELARLYENASPEITRTLGLGHEWRGRALVVWASALDVPAFNRAFAVGLAEEAREADIAAFAERFAAEGSPRAFIQVTPDARPAELPRWLEAHGFKPHNRWMRLARRLPDLPPESPHVEIRRVTPEQGTLFAEIFGGGFGYPPIIVDWVAATVGVDPWRHYLAYIDGEALGCAALAVTGEYAWFGYAATLARARGRGVQSALIAKRLHEAKRLGCSFAVMETAEDKPEKPAPSFRNNRRLGFELVYARENWMRAKAAAAAGEAKATP